MYLLDSFVPADESPPLTYSQTTQISAHWDEQGAYYL